MVEIAPGFTACPGDKAPSARRWGDKVYCIIRGGENGPVIGKEPWPIATQDWIHTGSGGDIIAIRRGEE